MAVRQIIRIDESKCDGCGDCVSACAEGAIRIINGKAKLINDTYCDGLGACLGECPQGAITIERREADVFDEIAVKKHLERNESRQHPVPDHQPHACPGSRVIQLESRELRTDQKMEMPASCLGQWPVQLALIPPQAPFLKNADIVVCADCVPFAIPDFHTRYLAGRAVLVGCPKLDDLQAHYQKMGQVFAVANPKSVIVLRMEVPCCGGIAQAAIMARNESAPDVPLEIHTIGINSSIHIQSVPTTSAVRNSVG